MESTSRIYTSPSFNSHSSNNIADIADRVVEEYRSENRFNDDDIFTFSDDEIPANISGDDEVNTEFEFPVMCRDSNSSPISTELVSDDQISPRFPLFDRSLLLDIDLNYNNDVNRTEIDSKLDPVAPAVVPVPPVARLSLSELFSEDRDSVSSSSSESDDLNGITPGTYCVWKPTEARGKQSKHKKSNSISIGNTSKRWKVRDLLKRSFSDDNYSAGNNAPVVIFSPATSPKQKTHNEKSNKVASVIVDSIACTKTVNSSPVKNMPANNMPAYKAKIGNIRLPAYLPYRQDQVNIFANYNGSSKNLYRY